MDRIDPVEDPSAPGDHSEPQNQSPDPASSCRPPPIKLRARGGSNRARRPSIRLSRLSSLSSLDSVNAQQQQQAQSTDQAGPSFEPSLVHQSTIRSPVAEEDESWQAGRRRSNSEPRPGRWSAPSPDVLSQMTTPMRMMPLTEESSHQSPISPIPQDHVPDQIEPPPAATRAPNRLRRTSHAAMNRFSRNRASTISGAVPTLSAQRDDRAEYGPHVVDMLDVIGKTIAPALSLIASDGN